MARRGSEYGIRDLGTGHALSSRFLRAKSPASKGNQLGGTEKRESARERERDRGASCDREAGHVCTVMLFICSLHTRISIYLMLCRSRGERFHNFMLRLWTVSEIEERVSTRVDPYFHVEIPAEHLTIAIH
jgi:hypothetical protein